MTYFERFLADWLRLADLQVSEGTVQSRRATVTDWSQSPEPSHVSDLVVASHQKGDLRTPGIEELRLACQRADSTFRMRGNDLEMRVIAAVTAVSIMESGTPTGTLAAYQVVCAAFKGMQPVLAELPAVAHASLARQAQAVRTPTAPPPLAPLQQARKALEDAAKDAQPAATQTAMSAFANTAVRTLSGYVRHSQSMVSATAEESNILWWLYGGASHTLDRAWSDVPATARPVIAAVELADLTRFVPGPRMSRGILQRALETGALRPRQLSPFEAIQAVPAGWKREHVLGLTIDSVAHFTPLLTVAADSLTSAGDMKAASRRVGLDLGKALPAASLAAQIYLELMMLRAAKLASG